MTKKLPNYFQQLIVYCLTITEINACLESLSNQIDRYISAVALDNLDAQSRLYTETYCVFSTSSVKHIQPIKPSKLFRALIGRLTL